MRNFRKESVYHHTIEALHVQELFFSNSLKHSNLGSYTVMSSYKMGKKHAFMNTEFFRQSVFLEVT